MEVLTVDVALLAVAGASIDDTVTITPLGKSHYRTEHTAGYEADIPESFEWSYDDGIELPPSDRQMIVSRVFHRSETWNTPEHVRYSLGDAVEALKAGYVVSFGYREVIDWQAEERGEDREMALVGWAVMATCKEN